MPAQISAAQARKLGYAVKPRRKRKGVAIDWAARALFSAVCRAHGLPVPLFELQFAPPRKWRFDYLFYDPRGSSVALEVQGGIWTQGRHVRGAALLNEWEKLNEAAIRGYRILYCQPKDIESGAIFPLIKRALA